MISFIPFLLSGVLDQIAGPEAWDAVMADSGFKREVASRLEANHADAGCRRIVDAACARLDVTEEQALKLLVPFILRRARESAMAVRPMGLAAE